MIVGNHRVALASDWGVVDSLGFLHVKPTGYPTPMNRSRYVAFGTLRPGLRVDLYSPGADPMHHPDETPVYERVLVTSEPEESGGRSFVRVQVGNDFSSIRIWEDQYELYLPL